MDGVAGAGAPERWVREAQRVPLLGSVRRSMDDMEMLLDELPVLCQRLSASAMLGEIESALRRNARMSLELRVVALFFPSGAVLALQLCVVAASFVAVGKITRRHQS